jgi:hypothetical protein
MTDHCVYVGPILNFKIRGQIVSVLFYFFFKPGLKTLYFMKLERPEVSDRIGSHYRFLSFFILFIQFD